MATVITIAQQKGGSGKSTVSVHLAVALSEQNKKVALIDIDPQGSTSEWYNIRKERSGDDNTRLTCIKAKGFRLSNDINRLQDNYDILIIDSPPHIESEARIAIRAADLVIIPLQPSPADIWSMAATIDIAIKEEKNYKILLNRYTVGSKILKDLEPKIPQERFKSYLGNRVIFASSMVIGKTVSESHPSSIAAEEVRNFTNEVNNFLAIQNIIKMKIPTFV